MKRRNIDGYTFLFIIDKENITNIFYVLMIFFRSGMHQCVKCVNVYF